MEKERKKVTVTRAEKRDGVKTLIREILAVKEEKHNELIDAAARLYAERFGGEDTENPNDVKGRVGSVLDVMKKENEVVFDGGVYALKKSETEEKPVKKTRSRAKKAEEKPVEETAVEEQEKPKRATRKKAQPLPAAPLQPIAPTAPVTPETAPEPIPEDRAKPATKKRTRKVKDAEVKTEEKEEIVPKITEEKKEEKQEEQTSPKGTVMDMSFLFGEVKTPKNTEKKVSEPVKAEVKTAEIKQEEKKPTLREQSKTQARKPVPSAPRVRVVKKALTADEKLQETFLNRLHRLGGEYFEYYSVYLLEKYSRKNGRRLEALKITGGDHDGGIDGEIELTDKLGFRETIYIQSKNWDPDKGDEKLWVVGETLLQQFIGACVCRQAKDGKQNCRGIFMTTSRFTPEAKRMLDDTSDKFVGYDGADIYETAKECEFGIVKKNGEWALDERLLSGLKAFYTMD